MPTTTPRLGLSKPAATDLVSAYPAAVGPSFDTLDGEMLRFRGAWVSTTAYAVNDLVVSAGAIFVATLASANQLPPNALYWRPFGTTPAELDAEATARANADALAIPLTQKAAANGVATLDAGGLVPTGQLPPLAITDTHPVVSQAAMLALTAQRGDVAIRSDLSKSFILAAEPASTLANWLELATPVDAVASVDGRTGVVSLSDRYVAGTDPRLSDARTPTGAAGGVLAGTYPNPAFAADMATQAELDAHAHTTVAVSTQTASAYTAVLADAGKVVRTTFAGASTLTIPANATTAFATGTIINAYAAGGALTIAAAAGVTIRNNASALAQYGEASLRKDGTDEWVRVG